MIIIQGDGEDERESVEIDETRDGRIGITKKDGTGSVSVFLDRGDARRAAMVIIGLTQTDRSGR